MPISKVLRFPHQNGGETGRFQKFPSQHKHRTHVDRWAKCNSSFSFFLKMLSKRCCSLQLYTMKDPAQAVNMIYNLKDIISCDSCFCQLHTGGNRNANMRADLLSKIFIPRFRRLELQRVTGFMHYVEEADSTFSHHLSIYHTEPDPPKARRSI